MFPQISSVVIDTVIPVGHRNESKECNQVSYLEGSHSTASLFDNGNVGTLASQVRTIE